MTPAQPLAPKIEEINGVSNVKEEKVASLDEEVDVVGVGVTGTVPLDEGLGEEEDPDATEQSSSFGNTFTGSEEAAGVSAGDAEIESQHLQPQLDSQMLETQLETETRETQLGVMEKSRGMGDEQSPLCLDGLGRICKKKKVSVHWRKFISPLIWRCQWLELQMNELRSQALLCDKELAAYKCEKQLQSKMIELDGSVSRSVPLSGQRFRKRVMKRKKRKKVEDTADISSYMSNHNIFSYYENKKSETDCLSADNDFKDKVDVIMKGNDGYNRILLGLEFGDDSLEKILLNLDSLQSRVLSLKTQLSNVMCRNSRSFSSSVLQGDPLSYSRSLSCSPMYNGNAMPPCNISESEFEVPKSSVSSYGDTTNAPITGRTVGRMSADASRNQRHERDLYKHDADNDLMNNRAADDELENVRKFSHGKVKPQHVVKEEAQSCSEDAKPVSKAPIAAPGPGGENGQPAIPKPPYTGKKRGRKPKRKRRGGSISGLNAERVQKRAV